MSDKSKPEPNYFWLRLHDDFFQQKALKKLRHVAGGDTYTIIYLKMQLLSLKNQGELIFDGIEDSFAEELALELDENVENVKMTLAFLLRTELIEQVNSSKYFLPQASNNMGSESSAAQRMRNYRERKKTLSNQNNVDNNSEHLCNNVTESSNNVTQSKEEKSNNKEKEKKIEKKPEFNYLGFNDTEISAIKRWLHYRKEIRKPYKTQYGLEQLRKALIVYKDMGVLVEYADNSRAEEWLGVFPPKEKRYQAPKSGVKSAIHNCNDQDFNKEF